MNQHTGPGLEFASALSARADTDSAADELCDKIRARLPAGTPRLDLGLLFVTPQHITKLADLERAVREQLGVATLLAVSASGVLADAMEIHDAPGVSLLVGSMPGVTLRTFTVADLPKIPESRTPEWAREHLGPLVGAEPGHRGTLLLTDPYSVPLVRLLPALAEAGIGTNTPLIGGVASAGRAPGQNRLALNGQLMTSGGIGLSFLGPVELDGAVSQGCAPIGPPLVITRSRGNVILGLGGRPALEVVREIVRTAMPGRRQQIEQGLLIGRVINEYKDRFGRDDFVIRSVRGIDNQAMAVLTDDFFKVGQTVRLHLRDHKAAEDDLAMLLDLHRLRGIPRAAVVISDSRRSEGTQAWAMHDARAITSAFDKSLPGPESAKSGQRLDVDRRPSLPTAGMFTREQVGSRETAVHAASMTLSALLLRSPSVSD